MFKMNVNWTNDLIFQLIDLYRERRLLWDHEMLENKDKVKKHQMWQDIADVMNINKEQIMKKMKILTTQFQREYAKCRQLPADEGGSKWFAYSRLLFLGPNLTTRTASSASAPAPAPAPPPPAPAAPTLNTYDHYQVSPLDDYTTEVKEEVDMSEGESFQSSASTSACARRRKRAAAEAARASPAASPASRDEYALYGEYVALKLRKLTDAYTRHKAQQQINDVLFQAEMEDLSQQ